MDYTRPEIVSGETRLDKPFFENILNDLQVRKLVV